MEGEVMDGRGHGPTPFLLKTYEMVDDSATDHIVSWSTNKTTFVVWDPPEFSRLLLPTYFKHNNFSSFIRQLNTYGFRKTDPERWEFGNQDFVKNRKHLLKNIRRRKPIHSHTNPSAMDAERIAFEEEIESLSREKKELEAMIGGSRHRNSALKLQFEDLMQRLPILEERQDQHQISCWEKAVKFPIFLEYVTQKMESIDVTAYCYRRRSLQKQFDSSNELSLELSPSPSSSTIHPDSRKSVGEGENCDDHASFHLNLTLASSLLPTRSHESREEDRERKLSTEGNSTTSSSSKENLDHSAEVHGRMNDFFWEQFLTETPGSSHSSDDADSNRLNEDHRVGSGIDRNVKNVEQLTL